MFATIKVVQFPFVEEVSAVAHTLASSFTKQRMANATRQTTPSHFVPRRQPISPKAEREIERLELAIRQGSMNAHA